MPGLTPLLNEKLGFIILQRYQGKRPFRFPSSTSIKTEPYGIENEYEKLQVSIAISTILVLKLVLVLQSREGILLLLLPDKRRKEMHEST